MKEFEQGHPYTNFIYYLSTVIFGMIFLHPVFLCISFFGAVTYYISLSGKKAVKTIFCFLVPMLLLVTAVNGIFSHYGNTVLGKLPSGNDLTLEPFVYGFATGLMVITVILWFSCYNRTVSSDKLIFIMGSRMPKIALILSMSLRFVPLYRERFRMISEAQKCMGFGNEKKLISKIKNAGRIMSSLFSWSLENGIATSDSMRGRGYGVGERTNYSRYKFTSFDAVFIICTIVFDSVVIVGAVTGQTYVLYNPFFKINDVGAMSYITYVSYFLLCFMPFAADTANKIRRR